MVIWVPFTSNPANGVTFGVEDASGPLIVFAADVSAIDPADLVPGAKVSVTADTSVDYYGAPELSDATVTGINGTGPVHVVSVPAGTTLDYATHGLYNVEIYGELVGDPRACGNECWDLAYDGGQIELRANTGYTLGDCVQWIGPMTQYFGNDQLDADDFDWARYY